MIPKGSDTTESLNNSKGIQKDDIGEPIFRADWRHRHGDTDIEYRFVDTIGEGEGGTNGENSIETYALLYVKQIPNGNLLYDAGSSSGAL